MVVLLLATLGVILSVLGVETEDGYVGLESVSYYAALLLFGPWAAGFVALWPNVRWAWHYHKGLLSLLRITINAPARANRSRIVRLKGGVLPPSA